MYKYSNLNHLFNKNKNAAYNSTYYIVKIVLVFTKFIRPPRHLRTMNKGIKAIFFNRETPRVP